MIYFLDWGGDGPIKIGTTVRLSERLKQLESRYRVSLRLIGVMSGGFAEESDLHRRFSHLRVREDHLESDEWFSPTEELRRFIDGHAKAWDGSDEAPDVDVAKIQSDVMRDARIVVAVTGEGLSEYLSRLLRPLIAKDKAEAIARESKPKR